jgi:hypothetical protein
MDTQPAPLRIKPRRLPAYVERKRARQAATDTADRERYEKPIDAHLAAQRMALDGLVALAEIPYADTNVRG